VAPRFLMAAAAALFSTSVGALDLGALNAVEINGRIAGATGFDPAIVKAQVLLDRAGFSSGEIDGRNGENFKKAINAFAATRHVAAGGRLTPELWRVLVDTSKEPSS
jgi:peptidoglycan hydrolase-like protein with peptidoglycan-binding domain